MLSEETIKPSSEYLGKGKREQVRIGLLLELLFFFPFTTCISFFLSIILYYIVCLGWEDGMKGKAYIKVLFCGASRTPASDISSFVCFLVAEIIQDGSYFYYYYYYKKCNAYNSTIVNF